MGKRNRLLLLGALIFALVVTLLPVLVAAQDEVTIKGMVNETGQLVDENDVVYEIADTEAGAAVMELSGQEVSVTGTVMEADGSKILTVTSYEALD
ncbi:MAG: hypothetical protein WBG37_01115 [Desulfobacterales bacterium]